MFLLRQEHRNSRTGMNYEGMLMFHLMPNIGKEVVYSYLSYRVIYTIDPRILVNSFIFYISVTDCTGSISTYTQQ